MPPPRVHTVFFDAMYTIVKPRRPISAQYAKVFSEYLGPIPEEAVRVSFPTALKELQKSKPAYAGGPEAWWAEVVRRSAVNAGANPTAVDEHLPKMIVTLMNVFGSKEGYVLYPEVLETFTSLKKAGVRLGVVSNTDSRMRDVLLDLEVSRFLDVVVLSGEEGHEKPSKAIWESACSKAGIALSPNVLHVGDELEADYHGAAQAGLDSILLRRPPEDGETQPLPQLPQNVSTIESLASVASYIL